MEVGHTQDQHCRSLSICRAILHASIAGSRGCVRWWLSPKQPAAKSLENQCDFENWKKAFGVCDVLDRKQSSLQINGQLLVSAVWLRPCALGACLFEREEGWDVERRFGAGAVEPVMFGYVQAMQCSEAISGRSVKESFCGFFVALTAGAFEPVNAEGQLLGQPSLRFAPVSKHTMDSNRPLRSIAGCLQGAIRLLFPLLSVVRLILRHPSCEFMTVTCASRQKKVQ